jgi:hypothetical protein
MKRRRPFFYDGCILITDAVHGCNKIDALAEAIDLGFLQSGTGQTYNP